MCDINEAFKQMIENTPGMTYQKLGMMLGENPKKLQALFDPDREDRPFQLKHMIPSMTACHSLSPLKLMNAHFGLSTFELSTDQKKLDVNAVLELMTKATDVGCCISKAIDPKSPGGTHLTRDERQACLNKAITAMGVVMGVINTLQAEE